LGGSGLQSETNKAIAGASLAPDPTLFPTAKVIGGYDFVGSSWDGQGDNTLAPDANPMDDNDGFPNGHGTHVASIIAGLDQSASGGVGPGMAPGAGLYALKVCSSVASSCSGIAMRQAFDWAADPNDDDDFGDRVDVVNLSLGAPYGQTGDQDLETMDQLSALGTIIAAAAGNGGNTPYILSSPSHAESVISVAQTTMPAAADAIVSTSSRGPTFDTNQLKPEIGAPGASVSASSGNQGYSSFSGTSGATPMVAGAVALLLDAHGGPGSLDWVAAKALLMNTAVHEVYASTARTALAPISSQGAGRLDVASAVEAQVYATVVGSDQAALSFGLVPVSATYQATQTVRVVNESNQTKMFDVSAALRFDADKGLGVSVTTSTTKLTVPAYGKAGFSVTLKADDPALLPDYFTLLGGGENLTNGARLTAAELDGFVTLQSSDETLSLPFHFLPRRAADISLSEQTLTVPPPPNNASVTISNQTSVDGPVEIYPLFDISPALNVSPGEDQQPVDLHYVASDLFLDPFDGDAQYDDHNVYVFVLTSYETRSQPVNARYIVYVDLDQDGTNDWLVYNVQRADGIWVSAQYNLHDGTITADLFALDTALNSNTMALYLMLPEGADSDHAFDFRVAAYDAYFGDDDGNILKWDESPLGGGYHHFDLDNPAFTTDTYYDVLGEGQSIQPQFMARLSSSNQMGFLFRFPNGVQEAAAIAMQPSGFYTQQLPVVATAE
ncbi:MAG: S8 family peptidase, partial [Candidatus Promineifilaceae bacterium]